MFGKSHENKKRIEKPTKVPENQKTEEYIRYQGASLYSYQEGVNPSYLIAVTNDQHGFSMTNFQVDKAEIFSIYTYGQIPKFCVRSRAPQIYQHNLCTQRFFAREGGRGGEGLPQEKLAV